MDAAVVVVARVVVVAGGGLLAGLFFAFSFMVMPALAQQSTKRAVTVMQAINATAETALFRLIFLLPAPAALIVLIAGIANQEDPGAGFSIVAGLCVLAGVQVLTVVYHVPRNRRLAGMPPGAAATADYWARYRTEWTNMNHARLAFALGACITGLLGA